QPENPFGARAALYRRASTPFGDAFTHPPAAAERRSAAVDEERSGYGGRRLSWRAALACRSRLSPRHPIQLGGRTGCRCRTKSPGQCPCRPSWREWLERTASRELPASIETLAIAAAA